MRIYLNSTLITLDPVDYKASFLKQALDYTNLTSISIEFNDAARFRTYRPSTRSTRLGISFGEVYSMEETNLCLLAIRIMQVKGGAV